MYRDLNICPKKIKLNIPEFEGLYTLYKEDLDTATYIKEDNVGGYLYKKELFFLVNLKNLGFITQHRLREGLFL